jgi:CBS domain-containing protein
MQVREIMTHEVEVIHPDVTLETASQKMRASNTSALPVCDGQQLVGILTERDLIGRATAKARNPQTAIVREVMTTDLLSCFEDQESTEALRLMQERQIRHLAVLSRDQRLVGIISLRDVAKPQHEEELAGSAIRWPA